MYANPPTYKEKLEKRKKLRKNSTPQEIIFWLRARAKRFKGLKFKRQYSIGKYIVDFVCLEKKLIVELDGCQHKEETQERYDQERTEFLEDSGFKVLRFWNNEVNDNLEGVFLKIEELLQQASKPSLSRRVRRDISPDYGREG